MRDSVYDIRVHLLVWSLHQTMHVRLSLVSAGGCFVGTILVLDKDPFPLPMSKGVG